MVKEFYAFVRQHSTLWKHKVIHIRTFFRHAFTFELHANYVHVRSSPSATCQATGSHMYALLKLVTQLYRMSHIPPHSRISQTSLGLSTCMPNALFSSKSM